MYIYDTINVHYTDTLVEICNTTESLGDLNPALIRIREERELSEIALLESYSHTFGIYTVIDGLIREFLEFIECDICNMSVCSTRSKFNTYCYRCFIFSSIGSRLHLAEDMHHNYLLLNEWVGYNGNVYEEDSLLLLRNIELDDTDGFFDEDFIEIASVEITGRYTHALIDGGLVEYRRSFSSSVTVALFIDYEDEEIEIVAIHRRLML